MVKLNQGKSEIFDGITARSHCYADDSGFADRHFLRLPGLGVFQNAEELATLPKFGGEIRRPAFRDLNGDGILSEIPSHQPRQPDTHSDVAFMCMELFGFDQAILIFSASKAK